MHRLIETSGQKWEEEIVKEISRNRKYFFLGDNIDFTIKPRRTRIGYGNVSYHWFASTIVFARIDDPVLDDTKPRGSVLDVSNKIFFHKEEEIQTLKQHFKQHLINILSTYIPDFKKVFNSFSGPIGHQFQEETKKKSTMFTLPVIFKSEKTAKEMQEILDILTTTTAKLDPTFINKKILVFSDQLTEARINTAKILSSKTRIPELRLHHFQAIISDFHACMNFGDAIYKVLGSNKLVRIPGTLANLKVFLSRKNVKPKVPDCYYDFEDFLFTCIFAYILEIHEFVLGTSKYPSFNSSSEVKKMWLDEHLGKIIDTYIDVGFTETPMEKTFDDDLLKYSSNLLSCGLFLYNFRDAIHQGDGERIHNNWKYLIGVFSALKRKNYR